MRFPYAPSRLRFLLNSEAHALSLRQSTPPYMDITMFPGNSGLHRGLPRSHLLLQAPGHQDRTTRGRAVPLDTHGSQPHRDLRNLVSNPSARPDPVDPPERDTAWHRFHDGSLTLMGVDLGYMVLIAFGSMKLTELYKEFTRRIGFHQIAWWKSVFNLACCAALTLLVVGHNIRTMVLIAAAASGLSALFHAIDTVLRSHRDTMVHEVFDNLPPRRR